MEVLPDQLSEESIVWQQYNTTNDGFLIVGSFNNFGIAEGSVDSRIGKLRELRLHVHSDSENWVILSEVISTTSNKSIEHINNLILLIHRSTYKTPMQVDKSPQVGKPFDC